MSVILIDPGHWAGLTDDTQKEALVFHELGHCVLGRQHRMDTVQVYGSSTPDGGRDTAYVSIMNPYSELYDGYYNDHKAEYLKELFQVP